MIENLIKVGYTQKPHGLNGELKFFIEEVYEDDFFAADVVFIEIKQKPVPHFMETVRGGNQIIVKLEDIKTREAAQMLSSKTVLMKATDLSESALSEPETEFLYDKCVGFEIIDQEKEAIGIIKEMLEMPQQEIAVIDYAGREVLIPLHPLLVKKLDVGAKKIFVELPDGLLDL